MFETSNGGKIKIDVPSMERMSKYIQQTSDSAEAGGILLGRLIKDSKDIVIDNITVPMIGDKRKRYSFKRGSKMHQRIADRAWKRSKGTCNYLGEWHTHPENYPSPSYQDIKDWKRKLKADFSSTRYLYFVIVGVKGLYVCEGDRRTLKIKELDKI